MAEEIIQARLWTKVDTLDNWNNNPLLLGPGELALVTNGQGVPMNMKWGDKTTRKRFSELPFAIAYDQGQFVAVTSTTLPASTAGVVRYSLVGEGTYTRSGQSDVVVPTGKMGVIVDDGTTWSLGSSVELPVDPNGVKKSDIDVQDGVASYDSVKNLRDSLGATIVGSVTEGTTLTRDIETSSTSKYIVQGVTVQSNGVISQVKVHHGPIATGTEFEIAQLRLVGSVYHEIAKKSFEVAASNSLQVYGVNFAYQNGDVIGVTPLVAGLVKWEAAINGKNLIYVKPDGTVSLNLANSELGVYFDVYSNLDFVKQDQVDTQEGVPSYNTFSDLKGLVGNSDAQSVVVGFTGNKTSNSSGGSTSLYVTNNLFATINGKVSQVKIFHGTLASGSTFSIVHLRKNGSIFQPVKSLTFSVITSNSEGIYTVDFDLFVGDCIALSPISPGLFKFQGSMPGYALLYIKADGTTSLVNNIQASIQYTVVEQKGSLIQRVEALENNGGSGYNPGFKELPASRRDDFKVKTNITFHDFDSQGLASQDVPNIVEDWGVMFFPENYSPTGKPTRMIISCHGTGDIISPNYAKGSIASFWTSQGYVYMDVDGLPDNFGTTTRDMHYGSPIALQEYIKGYQYAVANYNIYKEVFVLGTSMGGLSSFSLVQSGSIPVIAQAAFCPCTEHFKQAYAAAWNGAYQKEKIAQVFGFNKGTAPTYTASGVTQEEHDYYLLNYEKIRGFNPILKNVPNVDLANLYSYPLDDDTAEAAKYNALSKPHPVPLKIWHNTDDNIVAYKYSKYLVQMIRNAGGIAYLRTFTSGAHNAWLNGNDVVVNGVTTKASMAECYYWFERFNSEI